MAQKSHFTPAEDRIILRYRGEPAEVTNAALVKAGFPEQPADRITKRRYYLSRVRTAPIGIAASARTSNIARLEARRANINSEIERLDRRRSDLIAELREVVSELAVEVEAAAVEIAPGAS